MSVRTKRNEVLAKQVIKGLESRNMAGYYVATKEAALAQARQLIAPNSKVSWGGTASAKEIGLFEELAKGDYQLIDRDTVSTAEEKRAVYLAALDCDYYIGSVNAMTADGVMINVDGHSNRVAAYCYGAKHLVLIVGMNKVVKTEADAMNRARNEAAPINAQRFGINPPCVSTGTCSDCKHAQCICCNILITRFSQHDNRVHVILVDEALGF